MPCLAIFDFFINPSVVYIVEGYKTWIQDFSKDVFQFKLENFWTCNKKRTIQRKWQHKVHCTQDEEKRNKHMTICVGQFYIKDVHKSHAITLSSTNNESMMNSHKQKEK